MRVLKRGLDLYLWRHIQLNKSRLLLFLVLFILATMLFIINQFPYASVGLVLIPLAYVLGVYTYSKYMLWGSGIFGEKSVTRELEKLGNEYFLINGVVIPPNRGDTDHILLGSNGIFVVESKHYGGEISCKEDSWTRKKTGKRGKEYELWIGSPSRQVKRNAKVLKDFLLEHKEEIFDKAPHIWINAAVVFTNENTKLRIQDSSVPVLRLGELYDFVTETESEYKFSPEELERIGRVILKYSK